MVGKRGFASIGIWPRLTATVFCLIVAVISASSAHAQSRGEYLARAGNCVVCHSTPDGKPFAGGLKMQTPVGAIYTTNITPDRDTGIGTYTIEEFDRAVRSGVAKDGHWLYPAMPYPSYAKMTDDDVRSLYDFFMKEVGPAREANRASEIAWTMNMRWPLMLWNAVMTDRGPYSPKSDADAEWNRGAYLVQGLGHCGACHTPRGWAFQEKALDEKQSGYLTGATLDNWSASNLTSASRIGLKQWAEQDIVDFLKTGRNSHGTAFGTMTDVINSSTQYLTDADLKSIAKYLKSLLAARNSTIVDGSQPAAVGFSHPGAAIYVRQCEPCHGKDGQGSRPYVPALAGNPAVSDPNASSLVNIVLNGSTRIVVGGVPDIYRMPPFRSLLTDAEIARVVEYIRTSWRNSGEPSITSEGIANVREATGATGERANVLRMR